ncbi:ABC transporter permease [Actinoalloteichus caeruleus]|uniref:Transport permease protein n=1 Tax=Actinoalloteichus caeruleus DSM 43889 TaxID=1120930 RepID=A0ABT1JMS7_ACTCY|nr:ABC transporter permease [Actinoalloteichus caeruleus]MCP2333833.1 ABC-2 type transport system permease protein [Actinoalloteichus caeruleus DSM 43889]
MNLVSHTGIVFVREMRPGLRNPLGLVFQMAEPLVFLVLFGPLLAVMPSVGDGSTWQWFVPGIVVMLSLFGASGAGYLMLTEASAGTLERLLATPLRRTAILAGRTGKEVATLLVQALLIVLATLPVGFDPHPLGALVGLLLLAVFGVGLGSLSISLALAMRDQPSTFYGIQQGLLFPLLLLSGVLLPMDFAPDWLHTASRFNPLTYLVEAERALFAGDLAHPSVLWAALTAVAVAVVGLAVGARTMRRASC